MLRMLVTRMLRARQGDGHTPSDQPDSPPADRRILPPPSPARPSSQHSDSGPMKAADWLQDTSAATVPSDLLHPDKEGFEVVSTRDLMNANRTLITQALDAFTNKAFIPDFDDQVIEMIRRVAHWMGSVPASKAHHHSGRGGLFTHSLGVAVGALHMSVSRNVTLASAPRDRDADVLAWQLICFIGGLLHDIGKINTIGHFKALAVYTEPSADGRFRSSAAPLYAHHWEPMVEGFGGWVTTHRVKSYYIDFDIIEPLVHRDFTARYVMSLVPRPLLAFIYASNALVRQQFEDFIRNPESGSRAPVFQVVQDADHLNVAQSMDPRRKPGTIEMTSLVLRRFAEFAADALWNMPMSSFIYAHVQKETPDGLRFFGVPFFVASEASITAFLEFLKARPMLGVSFGERMTEAVFNCLETANVMNRTIEGILPRQISEQALQEFIPASRAELRFRATHVEGVMRPVNGRHEDLLISLTVVPIKCVIPAHVAFKAPTLAFHGVPSTDAATVVPTTVDRGTLQPSDPTLMNDPEFMKQFKALSKSELTQKEQELFPVIPPVVAAAPDRGNTGAKLSRIRGKLALPPGASAVSGTAPELPIGQPGDRHLDGHQQGEHLPAQHPDDHHPAAPADRPDRRPDRPQDEPLWARHYAGLSADPDAVTQVTFWPVVWLYLLDNPGDPSFRVYPTDNGAGVYGFRGSLPARLRDDVLSAVRRRAMSITPVSRFWPQGQINPDSPHLSEALRPAALPRRPEPAGKAPTMVFRPQACEIIEACLGGQGDAEGAA